MNYKLVLLNPVRYNIFYGMVLVEAATHNV